MTYKEAIKYFKMRLSEKTHPPTTAQQKAFTVAIEALEKADVTDTNVGKWIPCSERLPEDMQKVLIQYADSEDKNDIVMAVGWMERHLVCRDKRHFVCWDDRVDIFYDAVAWMPLPEPYTGDNEHET